jgi:hypothetical protein
VVMPFKNCIWIGIVVIILCELNNFEIKSKELALKKKSWITQGIILS